VSIRCRVFTLITTKGLRDSRLGGVSLEMFDLESSLVVREPAGLTRRFTFRGGFQKVRLA